MFVSFVCEILKSYIYCGNWVKLLVLIGSFTEDIHTERSEWMQIRKK